MPNSSARCAQLPRAVDKVPFYSALKKYRDYLRGEVPDFNEADVTFPEVKLQNFNNKRIKVMNDDYIYLLLIIEDLLYVFIFSVHFIRYYTLSYTYIQ